MAGDERGRDVAGDGADGDTTGAESRLRYRLRFVTIVVILVLLVFRVAVMPLIALATGSAIADEGITIGTLIGAALLLAGIEVPTLLSAIGNGKK